MKWNELIKTIKKNGAVLLRHGGDHDVYIKGKTEIIVSRHANIPEGTARAIIKQSKS